MKRENVKFERVLCLGMCSTRKYPYSPHRRDWNFLGGGGFSRTKKFKEMYQV